VPEWPWSRQAETGPAEDAPPQPSAEASAARLEGVLTAMSHHLSELTARTAAVEGRLKGLQAGIEALKLPASAPPAPTHEPRRELHPFEAGWMTAPLALRLRFTREMLEAGGDPTDLLPTIREAEALVDLWQKPSALEGWIAQYPALFADSTMTLTSELEPAGGPAETLACLALRESRTLLDATTKALGLEWIDPAPGSALNDEHEVVGEETMPGVADGKVARCRRHGFRWRGKLALPAQVYRQASGIAAPAPANENRKPETPPEPQLVDAVAPEWLRTLQRKSVGLAGPEVAGWMRRLGALAGADPTSLRELVRPLAPLLGAQSPPGGAHAMPEWWNAWVETRPEALRWLGETLTVEAIAPSERDDFDAQQMDAVGWRRTAHPLECGRVARLEQIGLRVRDGEVLFPARVVRYETGDED